MKSERNLVECKVGYTEQFAHDKEYRFEADLYGRYVAEIHDQRARAFFLSNSSIYRAVPDVPADAETFTPAAPTPLPPQGERAAPTDPDGNAPGNDAPSQPEQPNPEPEQNPAPAADAPETGEEPVDDAGEANEPEVLEGEVIEGDAPGTDAPAEATDEPAAGETAPNVTRESLEAMTKPQIIALADKLEVVVVKRDTKPEIIDQLLAGLE